MSFIPVLNPGKKFTLRRKRRSARRIKKRSNRLSKRRNPIGGELVLMNPRRRKSRRRTRRANPYFLPNRPRSRRRRSRRNPVSLPRSIRGVFSAPTLLDAAWGAAGFIGTRLVPGLLPIPVALKSGPFKYLTNAAAAFGLGMVARRVVGKKAGDMIWLGGLISVTSELAAQVVIPAITGQPAQLLGAARNAYEAPANGAGDTQMFGVGAYLPMESGLSGAKEATW